MHEVLCARRMYCFVIASFESRIIRNLASFRYKVQTPVNFELLVQTFDLNWV